MAVLSKGARHLVGMTGESARYVKFLAGRAERIAMRICHQQERAIYGMLSKGKGVIHTRVGYAQRLCKCFFVGDKPPKYDSSNEGGKEPRPAQV